MGGRVCSLLVVVLYNKHKYMIDNFFEDNYHSYDQIYRHPQTHQIIYLGDMQSALDDDFLCNKHIRTVVTAARDMDHIVLAANIKHIVYPLLDAKNQHISALFDSFYDLVEQSIRYGNILVHCAAGISRSSTLVISYIMKKQRMSFKEAISLVRQGRPSVLPNLGFQRQLKLYEKSVMKVTPVSRGSKRSEVKTSQSSKRPYLNKCELLSHKLKNRVVSLNMKKFMQKFTDKEMQILRIYNNKSIDTLKIGLQHYAKPHLNKLNTNKSIDEGAEVKVDLPRKARHSHETSREQAKYRKRIKSKIVKQQQCNMGGFIRYNKQNSSIYAEPQLL